MAVPEVRSTDDCDVETMAAIYVNAAREGWAHILGESGLETLLPPVDRRRAELASTDPRRQVLVAVCPAMHLVRWRRRMPRGDV